MAAENAPTPTATNMVPSWLTVEYASTRLMSFCLSAIVAPSSAVRAPTHPTTISAAGPLTYSAEHRHTIYTPAVTMVAAWISADTGVGPAIASGNHTYSGTCALFPHAPMNSRIPIPVATSTGTRQTPSITPAMLNVPNAAKIHTIPRKKPRSPTRFTKNAFFPAEAATSFSNSNPISKYEHSPNPPHPPNITGNDDASTNVSIIAMNKFK